MVICVGLSVCGGDNRLNITVGHKSGTLTYEARGEMRNWHLVIGGPLGKWRERTVRYLSAF